MPFLFCFIYLYILKAEISYFIIIYYQWNVTHRVPASESVKDNI